MFFDIKKHFKSEDMVDEVVDILIRFIQPHFDTEIQEMKSKRELVLVNSNFNCNYYLKIPLY